MYDCFLGEILIHADVYDSFKQMVSHVTPFTTWIFTINEARSGEVDLDAATSVVVRFEGSAVPSLSKQLE